MAGIVLKRSRQTAAEDSPAFGGIAERFRRAGDLDRAIALCQEGLRKFPGQLSARVTLGWALLDKGRYDEARVELEKVLRRAPDNLAAIRGLAELHDRAESSVPPMDGGSGWASDDEVTAEAPVAAPPEVAAPRAVAPPPVPSPPELPATAPALAALAPEEPAILASASTAVASAAAAVPFQVHDEPPVGAEAAAITAEAPVQAFDAGPAPIELQSPAAAALEHVVDAAPASTTFTIDPVPFAAPSEAAAGGAAVLADLESSAPVAASDAGLFIPLADEAAIELDEAEDLVASLQPVTADFDAAAAARLQEPAALSIDEAVALTDPEVVIELPAASEASLEGALAELDFSALALQSAAEAAAFDLEAGDTHALDASGLDLATTDVAPPPAGTELVDAPREAAIDRPTGLPSFDLAGASDDVLAVLEEDTDRDEPNDGDSLQPWAARSEVVAELIARPAASTATPGDVGARATLELEDAADYAGGPGSAGQVSGLAALSALPAAPGATQVVADRRSPVAALERFLRKVEARRVRILSESVA